MADSAPSTPGEPTTVTADALPTAQINGVVWDLQVVGDTAYATGSFTQARPAGSAAGVNAVTRNNLMAFSVSQASDVLQRGLNSQGMVLALSPDGKTLYVGGDFTTAGGASRQHIAAFNVATGALINTFAPTFNGRVRAIVATNNTVYIGGSFTTANGVDRHRLAAVSAANGACSTGTHRRTPNRCWL